MENTKAKKKMGLTTKIFVALIIGAIFGMVLHYVVPSGHIKDTILVEGVLYIVGQGFIAIAAVIFGKFRPQGALVACLLFGFCTGLKVVLGSNNFISAQIISMIPYVVTVIVLILFVGKSRVPSANGKPYVKSR